MKSLKCFNLNIKIQNYGSDWLQHLQRMEDCGIYLKRLGNAIHKDQ
jgi:hypothetical protein